MLPLRIALCAVLLMTPTLLAQDKPNLPVLRVAADMHTTAVNAIDADASGRLVLTVSDDKTARLWAVDTPVGGDKGTAPSAVLLRVLRPWTSDGPEGKLQACALSPSGSLAVVSGTTGETGKLGTTRIYFFDVSRGAMVRQISGVAERVTSLAFSASGSYLAAGLAGKEGLRIFDSATGTELARDEDYKSDCLSVDWHGDGSLVATCQQDNARLYRLEGGLLSGQPRKTKIRKLAPTVRGDQSLFAPNAARFSPDGSKVAVSSRGGSKVHVLDAVTLKSLYEPAGEFINVGDGQDSGVAWSSDGGLLAHGMFPINLSPDGGRGPVRTLKICNDVITELCAMPAAAPLGFLYASRDASWGLVQPLGSGEPRHLKLGAAPVLKFVAGPACLLVSDDATQVAYPLDVEGKRYASFSVPARMLGTHEGQGAPGALHAPRLTLAKSAKLTGQELAMQFVNDLDGKLLMDLIERGAPYCRAISSDGSFFVTGTDSGLLRYDRRGGRKWSVSLPMPVLSVNLSAGGRLAVAACGDGTIRWHRTSDGRELLAFLPHADGKRWVMWVPVTGLRESAVFDTKRFSQDLIGGFKRMGFQPGRDLLTSVNQTPVTSQTPWGNGMAFEDALTKVLSSATTGQTVTVRLQQAGRARSLSVTLRGEAVASVAGTYFDSSAGADDLIGWHVNRDRAQTADFFPAARFRSVFYRPDIVTRALKTLDVEEAMREANAALGKTTSKAEGVAEVIARLSPPVVEIETGGAFREVVLPADATSVKVRYEVRDTGKEKATRVQVKLNGRPLDVAAFVPAGAEAAEVDVPLPDGLEGDLAVIASHKLASSEAAILRVRRESKPANTRKPDLYLIAAGVSKLQANVGLDTDGDGGISDAEFLKKFSKSGVILDDLKGAEGDSQRMGELFKSGEGHTFGKVTSLVLINEEATTTALRSAIQQVAAQARTGDVVVFSFSGHGYADEKHEFFLATHDVHPDRPGETALTGKALAELLSPIKARVVLLLDTCQSGAVLGRKEGAKVITGPEDLTGLVNTLSSAEQGIVVISSSSESELSFESEGGGYFTRAVVEGLQGKASRGGVVTCASLGDYVAVRVPGMVLENPELKAGLLMQTPTVILPKGAPDFVLARP